MWVGVVVVIFFFYYFFVCPDKVQFTEKRLNQFMLQKHGMVRYMLQKTCNACICVSWEEMDWNRLCQKVKDYKPSPFDLIFLTKSTGLKKMLVQLGQIRNS
jgi:hypothetical protein